MDELELESSPAIRALGPLFKLTQVHLWDDGRTQNQEELPSPTEATRSYWVNDDPGAKFVSDDLEFGPSMEDVELVEQMNALGLPLSFQTNKQRKSGKAKVMKKNTCTKNYSVAKETHKEAPELSKVSDRDVASPTVFHDSPSGSFWHMSKLGQSELPFSDVAADFGNFCCSSIEGEGSTSLTAVKNGITMETTGINSMLCHGVFQDDLAVNTQTKDITPDISTTSHSSEACIGYDNEENIEKYIEERCLESSSLTNHIGDGLSFCSNSDSVVQKGEDGNYKWDADWRVYWDSFYQRNYYYNAITNVSTWFPPLGLEQEESIERTIESVGIPAESNEMDMNLSVSSFCSNMPDSCGVQGNFPLEEAANDYRSDLSLNESVFNTERAVDSSESCTSSGTKNSHPGSIDTIDEIGNICKDDEMVSSEIHVSLDSMPNTLIEIVSENIELHSQDEVRGGELCAQYGIVSRRKKKVRKARQHGKSSDIDREVSCQMGDECSANIDKYWCQRYILFSKFDHGVQMDEEGWFSVTPEPIARHHALRCGSGVVIDGFTGVGGNAIQFAKCGKHVIAVDIDPKKIEYAHHNAVIYEVDGRIDFVKGDFFCLAQNLKADSVFLSPPWGGPDYNKVNVYDIKTMLKPHDGEFLFKVAKEIASTVVMFLPKNVDLNQLAELAISAHPPWFLEVEKNFLNGKFKAITAYFMDTEVGTR